MNYTIGINLGHDASVTLLDKDGNIICAIGEERLRRLKSFYGWPEKALINLIQHFNLYNEKINFSIANSENNYLEIEKRSHDLIFGKSKYFDILNEFSWKYYFSSRKKINGVKTITNLLEIIGYKNFKINFYDHHLCHASSAYYTSGFNEALVFSSDGAGDGRSAACYYVNNGKWEQLNETILPDSPGHAYSWVTRYLGFKISRHEGKITGLAAYGNRNNLKIKEGCFISYDKEDKKIVNYFLSEKFNFIQKLICVLKGKPLYNSYFSFIKFISKEQKTLSFNEDLANYVQNDLEKAIVNWVEDIIDIKNCRNVVVAGGIFANVKVNQRINELLSVNNFWVFPDMSDGGLSTGAAYLNLYQKKSTGEINVNSLENVYLGPEYTTTDIITAINKFNLKYTKLEDPCSYAAKLLNSGKIIGWVQGRMEFGPRSLGNRSILIHPGNASINKTVNERLNRTEFMPFAPSVLEEYAQLILDKYDSNHRSAQFMTVTYDVKSNWVSRIPAVVHIDNTARPQIVSKKNNERFWNLLNEFHFLSGLPCVVNTSFNMHEEPIVNTPYDAINSYLRGAVDALIIDDILIHNSENIINI